MVSKLNHRILKNVSILYRDNLFAYYIDYEKKIGKIDNWDSSFSDNDIKYLFDNSLESITSNLNRDQLFKQFCNSQNKIWRLTLVVSDRCNLNCLYCYANKGKYKFSEPSKSLDKARIFKRAIEKYKQANVIHFFGGEPLMDFSLIKELVIFARNINESVKFSITTNGTISNQEIIDFLSDYSFDITISIDGPKIIHDKLRKTINKIGTYDHIRRNYNSFCNKNLNINIECTYTKVHLLENITVIDLLKFFLTEFGNKSPHIMWAFPSNYNLSNNQSINESLCLNENTLSEIFADAVNYSIQNLIKDNGPVLFYVSMLIQKLLSKEKISDYCPALNSQVVIGADGNIYPCFIFCGVDDMKFGNVNDINFSLEKIQHIKDQFLKRYENQDLWNVSLNSGCIGSDYLAYGDISSQSYSQVYSAIIKEVIWGLAKYY
jgi:uncharacterized protein